MLPRFRDAPRGGAGIFGTGDEKVVRMFSITAALDSCNLDIGRMQFDGRAVISLLFKFPKC